jgi:Microtubule-binding stalk of dynein motor
VRSVCRQVRRVKEYMRDAKFTVADLRTISLAAAGLLKWVFAMVNYAEVLREVEPKRSKVANAERSLRIAQRDLAETKVSVCPSVRPRVRACLPACLCVAQPDLPETKGHLSVCLPACCPSFGLPISAFVHRCV